MTTKLLRCGRLGLIAGACVALGCGWKLETREATTDAVTPGDAQAAQAQAPRARAAAFSLPNDDGSFVSLDDLLADGRPAVLVFYRGHW